MSVLATLPDPDAVIRAPGPWTHRDVSANGARFHVVEAGQGPMVILLHGFPTFWWTWRHALPVLAEAGYRAVAMDLRGYAGSDHTPHGYDPLTLSRDVAGVIRSLGEPHARVVGHGWGGLIAWSMAVLEPDAVSGIVPVSMPHPRRLRRAIVSDALQRSRSLYALGLQWPFLPERSLMAQDCQRVEDILRDWSAAPQWLDHQTALTYRSAFSLWPTAHCAVEYHRWAIRSIPRSDGIRYRRRMDQPIEVPVLQIHGRDDPSVLLSSASGSPEWARGPYELSVMDGVGHFPHEEAPAEFNRRLLDWLTG